MATRAPRRTPTPDEIDFSKLSPTMREVLSQVFLRMVAGLNFEEIAEELQRTRPQLKHLPLPQRVTKAWVSARARELRTELTKSLDAAD